MQVKQILSGLKSGAFDANLKKLYGEKGLFKAVTRYTEAVETFGEKYGEGRDAVVLSVCGRSEISGNHTDHNLGRVIAASIDLDIVAVAAKNDDGIMRVLSCGFGEDVVGPSDAGKKNTSSSLIAGVAAGLAKEGYVFGGFDAYTVSDVLRGSGLSSSAAFEDMIGTIINHLYLDGRVDDVTIAKISQFAENEYFGKPCGLMDQVACISGGFVTIDFADKQNPIVEKLPFDLTGAGYQLVITDTGGSHAALSGEYAAIPSEMKSVAAYFGKEALRGVCEEDILSNISSLRSSCGDRAVLRALHFVRENVRVEKQVAALRAGDLDAFLHHAIASGRSSALYLQNAFTSLSVKEQGITLALCLSEKLLEDKKAAWRLHGGGFAGTIQAFVPMEYADWYSREMDKVFGEGAAHCLSVRADSGVCVIR